MNNECKECKVNGHDLVEVVFRHFPGETEENHENIIRITDILIENRTEYFQIQHQERCLASNGDFSLFTDCFLGYISVP